jgi:hypothetical protein
VLERERKKTKHELAEITIEEKYLRQQVRSQKVLL